jgi:hypothetical protein
VSGARLRLGVSTGSYCSFKRRHTSVVVFGKEIFYGQGINMTAPGQSHVRPTASASMHTLTP